MKKKPTLEKVRKKLSSLLLDAGVKITKTGGSRSLWADFPDKTRFMIVFCDDYPDYEVFSIGRNRVPVGIREPIVLSHTILLSLSVMKAQEELGLINTSDQTP